MLTQVTEDGLSDWFATAVCPSREIETGISYVSARQSRVRDRGALGRERIPLLAVNPAVLRALLEESRGVASSGVCNRRWTRQ